MRPLGAPTGNGPRIILGQSSRSAASEKARPSAGTVSVTQNERVSCGPDSARALLRDAPGIEVVRPGLVVVAAQGPVGYFKSTEAAAERLVDHVAVHAGVEAQVGFADGLFAATLAAHRGLVVPTGRTREFLAPLGIHELDQPAERRQDRAELVDLLRRLGLRTLGAFAAVPERDVATRFGRAAVLAHRLAAGLEERPRSRRRPSPELSVTRDLDPTAHIVASAAVKLDQDGLRTKVGELTMDNELLYSKIDRLEAGAPFRLRRSKR